MSITTQLHLKAWRNEFELICLFAALALIADLAWCVKDMIHNGVGIYYLCIASSLFIATIGTLYIVWQHHKHLMHEMIHQVVQARLQANKKRNKHLTHKHK